MSCTNSPFDEKLGELSAFIEKSKNPVNPQASLIAVLQRAQELFGYLPKEAMAHVACELGVPEAYVFGVATFYSHFTFKSGGKYPVSVCMGTACYVKGAPAILDTVKEQLRIEPGETTEDGLFSLTEAKCVGSCGQAPVMVVGDQIYGHLTADQVPEILAKHRKEGE
jgi:NADH:ubiquinone oxidoreductase subunit E